MYEVPADAGQVAPLLSKYGLGEKLAGAQLAEHEHQAHELVSDLETAVGIAATVYVLHMFKSARVLVGLLFVYFGAGTSVFEGQVLWAVVACACCGSDSLGNQGQDSSPPN